MALRDAGNAEKVLEIAQTIVVRDPSDAMAQYQLAWTLDALGRETEAVGHYEFALSAGLGEPERENAMLADSSISMYHRAIELYAEDLNRRW